MTIKTIISALTLLFSIKHMKQYLFWINGLKSYISPNFPISVLQELLNQDQHAEYPMDPSQQDCDHVTCEKGKKYKVLSK